MPRPDPTRRTLTSRAAAGLLAGGLVVTACGLTDGTDGVIAPLPTTTTTTVPPSPATYDEGPCPFESPDGAKVICGELEVPLDRLHPDAGTVTVATVRIRTPSADLDEPPVLYFEGGPGGASLVYTDYWADHRLADHREVILFDQRGTGYSEPNLSCDPEFADAPADESDVATYERCRDRLGETTDPEQFTTPAAAQDVVDLLEALDLPAVDLLGISYGTRLALATVALDPPGVRSIVLDSVYPPGVEAMELQGPNGQLAFDALFDLCATTPACAEHYPDLEATFTAAVEALDADPTPIESTDDAGTTSTEDATGTDLIDAVFGALYDRTLFGSIPYAIDLAARGTPADRQEAFDVLYGETVPGGAAGPPRGAPVPSDDSDGLYYSVTCSEEMPVTSLAEITDAAAALEPAWRDGLTAGVEEEVAICEIWDEDGSSEEPLAPVASDLPTLLLAGSLDPITPPHWAREAAETLTDSTVFELPAVGHGVMDSHLCGFDLVMAFLDDPDQAPAGDCIDEVRPPTFAPPR